MAIEGRTRRAVVKAGGGLAMMALAGLGHGQAADAGEASPEASPVAEEGLTGRYMVVRARTLAADLDAEEVLLTIRKGYVPLAQAIPGFVAYLGITNPSSRQTAFVTVYGDKAGTDESTRQAGAWLTENGYAFFEGDPIVVGGSVQAAAGSLSGGGERVEGDAAVIRLRTLKPDRSGAELSALIQAEFVPLVTTVPGFVAYLVSANEETRDQFSIGIYDDAAGATASTEVAGEWAAQRAGDYLEGEPVVIEGTIGLAVLGGGS